MQRQHWTRSSKPANGVEPYRHCRNDVILLLADLAVDADGLHSFGVKHHILNAIQAGDLDAVIPI